MNTKLRRSVAAIATAFACLALMASPASAITHTTTITGGNLVLTATNTLVLTFPFAGTAGTGCGSTLVLDEGATGDADIASYTSTGRFTFGGLGFVYVLTRTASTPGTVSGGGVSSSTLALQIDIFSAANANPATDCATSTARCRMRTTLYFAGTLSGWGVSDTASLSYPTAGLVVASPPPPCVVPFSSWGGGAVTGGPLDLHITS